jgi:hypothetical protein
MAQRENKSSLGRKERLGVTRSACAHVEAL